MQNFNTYATLNYYEVAVKLVDGLVWGQSGVRGSIPNRVMCCEKLATASHKSGRRPGSPKGVDHQLKLDVREIHILIRKKRQPFDSYAKAPTYLTTS